ncbi:exported hypothetical protein [Gammaproteobacteria bacterium]
MNRLILLLAILVGPLLPSLHARAAGLNDTGQDTCFDGSNLVFCTEANTGDNAPYPRQDGRYGRDTQAKAGQLPKTGGGEAGFDFTALDANGNPTTPTSGANPHPCVRDNVTGLVWEVKTSDGGLRDQQWSYTWYDSNPATNGGANGTANGGTCKTAGRCDTEKYAVDINATGLCGFRDWRVPNREELHSITHAGRVAPSIDPAYFPNTPSTWFWTSSSGAYDSGDAWYVDFNDGGRLPGTAGSPSAMSSNANDSSNAWNVNFNNGNVNNNARGVAGAVRLARGGK